MDSHRSSARGRCVLSLLVTAAMLGLAFGVNPREIGAVGTPAWGEVKLPPGRTTCYAIEQTDEQIAVGAFAGGTTAPAIQRTYDGGRSWQTVCEAPVGQYLVNDIDFYDQYHGFAVGQHQNGATWQSLILETQDGGLNWTRVDGAAGTGEAALVAVDYGQWNRAAAVGSAGLFYCKELNGLWTPRTVSGGPALHDVAVTGYGGDMLCVAVGDNGELWTITRTPVSWVFADRSDPDLATEDLLCVANQGDAGSFAAFGDGAFGLYGTNAAATWERDTGISLGLLYSQEYFAADFRDYNHGLVGGTRFFIPTPSDSKALRRTSDALASWTSDALPAGGFHTLVGVSMFAEGESWVHSPDTLYHRATPTIARYGGVDRYATALQINGQTFQVPYGQAAVFATGKNFPDALCAAGLAGTADAPLMIVRDTLTDTQLAQLLSLGVDTGYIVGGEDVVSDAVGDQLTSAGIQWLRFGGSDRYATAAAVADRICLMRANRGQDTQWALVARGDLFPDALALSPHAFSQEMPILLTRPTSLPAATAACIDGNGFEYGVVAGDVTAVSDAVKDQIDFKFISNGGSWAARWGGATRYDTAAIIAQNGITNTWATGAYIGVATGLNFPDALVGGCAAGANSGVLLLTKPAALSPEAETCVTNNRRYDTDIRVYGGSDVVSDVVYTRLESMLP